MKERKRKIAVLESIAPDTKAHYEVLAWGGAHADADVGPSHMILNK
jgi:hypothetical protein